MKVKADTGKFYEIDVDALVVSVFEGETAEEGILKEIDDRVGGTIASVIGSDEMRGKSGELVYIHNTGRMKARRLLLVGAGKREEFSFDTIRQVAGAAARFLRSKGVKSMAILRRSQLDLCRSAQSAVEGALIGLYEPDAYKTQDKEERHIEQLVLATVEGDSEELIRGVERGRILGQATNFARELINEPSNILTPTEMAERAKRMAERFGLEIDILDEAQMKELGMGALLGVSAGSDEPAKLIVLTYTPEDPGVSRSKETIALVGKGITFDSGGISLKPAEGMEKMKYDMAGGAAVIGAMQAIAQLKPEINVIGIVPAVENMPSGRAQNPGDVVRAMNGKTIEVINTDAEGRLILADAVSYARKLGATKIVDLATLTGACLIALGTVNIAVLGNDQQLVDDLIEAGKLCGEKMWQLPLDKEYREQIKSDIADIKNTGGRNAGTITGAYFIREFAEDTPWAHLDIAGTAWINESKPYISKGPAGVGVRTLVELVQTLARR